MLRIDPKMLFASALLVVLVACVRHENAEMAASAPGADLAAESAPALPPQTAPMEAAAAADAGAAQVQSAGVDAGQFATRTGDATDPKRRFVRTASASFQVQEVYAATLAIEDAVAGEGGFVASNRIATQVMRRYQRPLGEGRLLQLSEVRTTGTLVVRVPGERIQQFLRVVARHMQFLDARSFQADDVQFDILRKQLAFDRAQALQQDIRDAGAQPGKTGDKVDAVQARAGMLAARDEARVAQHELEDRIAFATLTLELAQPMQVREQTVPDTDSILRDRAPGFLAQVREGLAAGWRGLLQALVAAVYLWPLWLVLAIAVLLARGMLRWRSGHRDRQAS